MWQRATELALRYQAGDEAALATLFEIVRPAMHRWLRRWFVGAYRGADQSDLWQEAYIALWRAIDSFDPGRSALGPWLKGCLHRRLSTYIRLQTGASKPLKLVSLEDVARRAAVRDRSGKRLASLLAYKVTAPEDVVTERESLRELSRLMREILTPLERRCFAVWAETQKRGRGRQSAVRRMYGYSVKSVDNALARAKRKLRAALGEGRQW